MLIDVAIPGNRNVIGIESEKILKYKDLIIEIQRMWIVRAKVTPVIIGASETISNSLRQYLSNISREHKIKELQNNSHFGNWANTSDSTGVKVQNIFHGAK